MKIYIISDTHFNHDRIIEFCNRPANHEEILFKNMMKIKKEDCLIHLGDFCWGEDAGTHTKYLEPLECRKILVMGNHDSKTWSWYMEHGWDFVCDVFRLKHAGKHVVFSHMPQAWDGVWEVNVHGHFHNTNHRLNTEGSHPDFLRLYAPECMGYCPVEVTKFITNIKGI